MVAHFIAMPLPTLYTTRLHLRPWRASDRIPFAALNADAEVMEHFPSTLTTQESNAMIDRLEAHIELHGFGPWAVEIPNVTEFAGFIGLAVPSFEAPFAPAIEVAWRLARANWGKGYATEGAKAAVEFAFTQLNLSEVVAFTVPENLRSIAVMKRLGMKYAGEFLHPHVATTHLLYRLLSTLPGLQTPP
jgi:RimJ/RimL family protein N-acetyltransferase